VLTNEQVLPTCYFWAKRFYTKNVAKRFPFDELVNVGFVVGKKLDSPLLLQKWVKFTIQHYIRFPGSSIPDEILETDIEDKSFSFKDFGEMQDELARVIEATCDEKDKKLLYLLFWCDMTYEKAASELGLSGRQGVEYRFKLLRQKLRREYERRARV
jgi:hypothetical protein